MKSGDRAPDGEAIAPGACRRTALIFAGWRWTCCPATSRRSRHRLPASTTASGRRLVSGLVARAGRDVIAALGAPDLWCMEHGAHIARVLVEVRIYIQWMAQQDPSIYRAFQDYGAGKAKLYAQIMDELPPEARRPDFEEAIEELKS